MNTDTLQHLNLTEYDFELILQGLDAIPKVDTATDMMTDIFLGILTKKDREAEHKYNIQREAQKRRTKGKQALLEEDIKILQSKLILLKRYLIEQGALKEVNSILNNPLK